MKGKYWLHLIGVTILTILTILPVWADELGFSYDAIFPFTVTIDGKFNDWPTSAKWHKVGHDSTFPPYIIADNDNDSSFEFASVADEKNLYVAIKIWDDVKCSGENTEYFTYLDDSAVIYIDGDNSKPNVYEEDVCQMIIGRDNVNCDPNNPILHNNHRGLNSKGAPAGTTGTKLTAADTDYGWALEASIPLAFFKIPPKEGTVIGFNIQITDDDDWGARDHQLSWSKMEVEINKMEAAYYNPSVFGELKFISTITPVYQKSMLNETWGKLKQVK
jgi:hypothetical protein